MAGYPRNGTLLEHPNTPDETRIYRHTDVMDRPDLFGNFHQKYQNPPRPLPDCFSESSEAVVSRAFKDAIKVIDPEGCHQFMKCKIYATDGAERSDLEYYHFLCGRIVFLPDEQKRRDLLRGSVPDASASDIFDSLERARFLSTLPIWCDLAAIFPMYFSQEFWEKLQPYNLIGFDEYTQYGGNKPANNSVIPETVGQIWVDIT